MARRPALCSEAIGIVFATEGLRLTYDFNFYCGIRVERTGSLALLGLDPADRIIAATSILESATLVTKDSRIRTSLAVTTIW